MDAIIALDEMKNFTAFGELYLDDSVKKGIFEKTPFYRL